MNANRVPFLETKENFFYAIIEEIYILKVFFHFDIFVILCLCWIRATSVFIFHKSSLCNFAKAWWYMSLTA